MSLFDPGDEFIKGACHGATGILAALEGSYNWVVWRRRGTAWHLFSAVVYGSLVILEAAQVSRHTRGHQ